MDDYEKTISDFEPIQNLITTLLGTGKKYDIEKIKRAFIVADKLHAGQFRVSGEPYISHPIAVAEIVAGLELDTDSICAALLHDTVEDCGDCIDEETIRRDFGEDVAMLVDGLTKLVQLKIEDKEEAEIENLRKMFLAMSKDIRVIFIKLCDRLHNMRTLDAKPEHKRRITALETMHVYAPLAHRLGMQRIKQELERHALSYLDPIGFEEVQRDIDKKFGAGRNFIENTKENVAAKLGEYNIKFTLEGRVKSTYSIYKKMYNQNKSFDEIYDFYAIRIIVDTELECYTVLGIIHEMYKSLPGRFKDYISTPKPNMYRSLHTTVIGRDGIPFEVQIRTWDMHHVAEYGICAHWKYKSGSDSREDIDQKLQWVAKLLDSDVERDPDEFMRTLKIDMFHDETFVFTPKGDVIVLPQGATLIDFAYAIHSAIGNKMVGAKINGAIATIDSSPKNGDIVEIITSGSSRGPSRDWLKIVKTGEARNKIRQWFKKEKRAENIVVGKAEVERELKKHNRPFTDAQCDEIAGAVAARIGIKTADDLYNTVGYGGLSVTKLQGKLKDEFDRRVVPAEPEKTAETAPVVLPSKSQEKMHAHSAGGIVIDGAEGCAVKFARCCNPLPGDSIVGFITKGFGVSIHKTDCPNVKAGMARTEDRDRFVSAWWEAEAGAEKNAVYEGFIQVYAQDMLGLLAQVSATLADMRVSINSINSQKTSAGTMILNIGLSCRNTDHVNSIVSRIKAIHGVVDVQRGFA